MTTKQQVGMGILVGVLGVLPIGSLFVILFLISGWKVFLLTLFIAVGVMSLIGIGIKLLNS